MDASKIRLRNFPLHVDEMERLSLDPKVYTVAMAEALALLHWSAGIDANDVEFVLGCRAAVAQHATEEEILNATKYTARQIHDFNLDQRAECMWLLDFNECKRFKYGEQGIKMPVDGLWVNDPYYPRPNATNKQDEMLWELFMARYLELGRQLVSHGGPAEFTKAVMERGHTRSRGSMFA
ncbi:hypothetical protein ACJBU6_09808 [Exserohilum turcicum]